MNRRPSWIYRILLFTFPALFLAGGCVRRIPNPPLAAADLERGYYFHSHTRPNNSPDTVFILCFSGGGTRAAALSLGVLDQLRQIPLERNGRTNRLLDEVDAISSVSGGSVTAAAYALYGDQTFDLLDAAFLKRNVQQLLFFRVINPFRWPKLMSRTFGRSDLAADLYDELLFRGRTFGDLSKKPGAFVAMNATDISTGARFSFTQYQFDLLCTDLTPLRVSQAVAASSAVPGLLSPITIDNHAGTCGSALAEAVRIATQPETKSVGSRARFHFLEMATYLDRTNHPYVHLVDGGVSDNLGIRGVLDGIYAIESNPESRPRANLDLVQRVAIVVVNAYSKPDTGWAKREEGPGSLELAIAGATVPMDRYSYETVELLKEQVEQWRARQHEELGKSPTQRPEVRFYPVIVSFADLTNVTERSYFLNQPTSFYLPDDAVDKLKQVGGRLLLQSPTFKDFLRDLNGEPVHSAATDTNRP
ncbi:MAG: patatin-like phospholipase family protein [Verrucomicrobiales bacterium]|nr:patatin-like phospholipase family protein [Verrucomicrobiales bacterium]